MDEKILEPKWDPKHDIQFTYKRGGNQGDIEIYATSEDDAIRTLKEHGFKTVDRSKLTRTGKTLSEHLASAEKKEPIR